MTKRTKAEIQEDELTADQLLYTLLANKVGSIDPSQVISHDKNTNTVKINGQKLKPNELTGLKQEATFIKSTRLWKIFTETLRHEAQMRMFQLAKTERDMDWGKSMLHAIGVFEHLIAILERLPNDLSTPPTTQSTGVSVL